ncbi:hypothetical protein DPV78_011667 [Talaromyces pinophilus]|nr:hypothetical protein DPV78_011667 [Talaromyces pinophilus]
MAGLLQIHRPGVTLPTFETLTHPSAYKNAPKTPQHRTVLEKVRTIINMEHQAQRQINGILNRVRSLDDLSINDVLELRSLSEQCIVLDKFRASPAEYWNWLDKFGDDIRGVEYDAQNAREKLSAATGSDYILTGRKRCRLRGKFSRSSKEADASVKKFGTKWPVVVLEEDAKRWLKDSCGQTKLVILVDVQERGRWNTSNDLRDKWEISEIDFQQPNHDTLPDKILQWYQSREIRLVGSFKLSVHLCYSKGDNQCLLNKAAFSPDNLIDLTTIQDVPLRLDHLMPDGSDLDMSQPLLFPLRRLVQTLQNGFDDIESDRVDDLAENALKKYSSS